MINKRRKSKLLSKTKMAFLSITLTFAVMYIAFGSLGQNSIVQTNTKPDNVKTIVIDAGHGGEDGGAVGVDGICEKDINLSIANKLQFLFEFNGYNVVMTRDSDKSIHDDNCKTMIERKKSDIRNRLKIIQENKNAIVLSIHQNKFEQKSCKGAQIFYGKKNENSKILAECLQKSFVNKLQPDNKRTIQKDNRKIYLLENATTPIVLVECGFLSNYEDAKNLVDDDYQKKIAFTIFKGVLDYYDTIENNV